ncbi:MAG: hypothetical protein ACRC3Y_07495 [Romboutsia sp.]|uniref:hypothetical protein n=1 Tax=Romboutsia sp. TaxID=1965302 RepID=UPI003F34FD80
MGIMTNVSNNPNECNKCTNCYKYYCESLEDILSSESNISCILEELLCQDILNWLETVPDVQTRVNLLTSIINSYNGRTCSLGKLVCCSTELLRHCRPCPNTNCTNKDNCNFRCNHCCNYNRCDCDCDDYEKCDCDNSKSNKTNTIRKNKLPKQ